MWLSKDGSLTEEQVLQAAKFQTKCAIYMG